MESTRDFFSKLRKLAVTLEAETEKLQQAFEGRRNEDGDSDTAVRAMRAFHEVNSDVSSLKVQLQAELAEQKQREEEVSNFIKACRVMERRVSKDIHTIRTHLEKYGYQAPSDAETPNNPNDQEAEEDETGLATEEDEGQEEDERTNSTPPPTAVDPFADLLRTPKLSDFGLSELQMKRALGGAEWCAEVPPMPELNLPQPSLRTPAPPPLAMTPKCALRMDDDDLQTPQMRDFGISEDTMCLNNDFTMALFRKKDLKPDKPSPDIPSINEVMESLQTKVDNLESPEPPVICTPGFKIKKPNGHLPSQETRDPESPCRHGNPSTTPEVPVFETPYVSRLVSCKKTAEPEPVSLQGDRDRNVFELQTSPCNGASDSKPAWEYNVPEVNFFGVEEKEIPEMPNLESFLGNSLQTKNGRMLRAGEHEKVGEDTGVNRLDLDGPTQEFSFGTPRIRMSYQEPSTPEMPDLSSVTQDICKLVSQVQTKKSTSAPIASSVSSKKHSAPPAKGLSLVSQSEFQTLPSYLRLMTLGSLNQAVQNINRFTAQHGETKEFTMDDLRRIISVGTKAPVYVLCLTELQRLKQVDGVLEAAVYKLITGN
ncbi:PREDICTED: spindle and kinetochore-associated protein 3-like isoform X2 [Poecilia mexicana]|uniref:spindle and kinetochore-associated protein 3-like isoform X2 n=1 Tax=Poecilia mexicana TaxID=48701 RepID=UPI00072E2A8D|nr:PREDICTED: spindle and kinetochore-associated protein 3-like isoform X2 [Poecilia mexicana]